MLCGRRLAQSTFALVWRLDRTWRNLEDSGTLLNTLFRFLDVIVYYRVGRRAQ
jgi:hypothetical protein